MFARSRKFIEKNGGLFAAIKQTLSNMGEHGVKEVLLNIFFPHYYENNMYRLWMKHNEKKMSASEIKQELDKLAYQPKISVIIPVYNVDEVYLRLCIDSVVNQYYQNYELCIADDASTKPHVKRVLDEYVKGNDKIKVFYRPENGHISKTSNDAIKMATGEFIALLDNDDSITPDALLEMVKMINKYPDVDMLYSDEDKIDADNVLRNGAFFKPDWSPDAFWGHMYPCHFAVFRKKIIDQIGGFRVGVEGAQDYDLVFRVSEVTQNIKHVPKILYHWRMIETSTAFSADTKNYAYDASIQVKKDALARRGINAEVEELLSIHGTNIKYIPKADDFVSIIIPTHNHGEDVKLCVDSIYEKSTWKNFEIILVDNNSTDQASLDLFAAYAAAHENFTVLEMPIPFNYSKLNNEAVKHAKGDYVLFLNNDTQVITPDWLERLLGQASQPQTGAVGAKLLYPDDTVQHTGIIMYDVGPGHAHQHQPNEHVGYFARALVNYNYLAVTGACLMVNKEKFLTVGGFDEEHLQVAYNDVELGIKLYDQGFYNVVRNDVELYHFESKSRGEDKEGSKANRLQKERAFLYEKWGHIFENGDPFYNINLVGHDSNFTIARPKKKKK